MGIRPPTVLIIDSRQLHRIWTCIIAFPLIVLLGLIFSRLLEHGWLSIWKTHQSVGPLVSAERIIWWPCPDITTQECAYLTVPLDYTNPHANETVSLFIRKQPASATSKDYLGSMFLNPGGPGGSGSNTIATVGEHLSAIFDGRYDIISWDPRGVNMTLPPLGCHPNEGLAIRAAYDWEQIGRPLDGRGPSSWPEELRPATELALFRKLDAYARSANDACGTQGNQKMLQAVSTSFVVRDMARMVEALGESKKGITYWGWSYGTIIGATFAAMYPELVHRMVLDGVSDAVSYTHNLYDWGRNSMNTTIKTYEGFLQACLDAGPARCALASPPITNITQLGATIDSLFESLADSPLPVPTSNAGPGILTASMVYLQRMVSLYSPSAWPTLAKGLAQAIKGDGTVLFEQSMSWYTDIHPKDMTKNVFGRYMEEGSWPTHTMAIMCGDSAMTDDGTDGVEAIRDYFHELGDMSPAGEIWAGWMALCRHWKIEPFETYRGPWTVEDGLRKTKFPVMFLSLTADPVTPLTAAKSMSMGFGNESATLLIQEGFGHGSLGHPSLCTTKKLREYFMEGIVPAYGTLCKADPGFLFPNTTTAARIEALSEGEEDQRIAKAMHRLAEGVGQLQIFGRGRFL